MPGVVNPAQLKLFMSAREIDEQFQPPGEDYKVTMPRPEKMGAYQRGEIDRTELYAGTRETTEQVWERKRNDWAVMKEGKLVNEPIGSIVNPIPLTHSIGSEGKPKLGGGSHRVAVKLAQAPDELMPVLHYTDTEAAQRDPRYR